MNRSHALSGDPLAFMQGGGTMGALMRSRDWDASELGPPAQWPQTLKAAISSVLSSGTAMHISWGDNLLQFYNDAYTPVLTAGKHPAALGRALRGSFPEIWDFIQPLFDRVRCNGEAVAMENAGLMMYRDGVLQESYFNFSYSPIRSLSGDICGVAAVCWETTEEVIVMRRERALRALNEQLAAATNLGEVQQAVRRHVEGNRVDLPFLLWYERDEAAHTLRLRQAFSLVPDAPLIAQLGDRAGGTDLSRALDPRVPMARRLPLAAPANPWLIDPPPAIEVSSIAVEPMCYVNFLTPDAYLVFGIGAQRSFGDSLRSFHESTCRGVERAVRRISAVQLERRESVRQFHAVTSVVPSMVWMTDAEGACTFVSRRWLDFTGRTDESSLGSAWMSGVHPDDLPEVQERLRDALAGRGPIETLYRFRRADGEYRWMMGQGMPRHDERGNFLGMIGSSLDITERKALEDGLVQLASEDWLTGLPNRRHFRECLLPICRNATDAAPAALVFMDLDNFKTVNDSLTHEAGDVVLKQVAARLSRVVPHDALVSRLGGDEFAIALPGYAADRAAGVATAIAAAMDKPFFVQSMEVFLTASLGIAMAPAHAADADALIRCADLAMYEVKRGGRNGIAHYQTHLQAVPASMLSLRGRMARALERDEYFALYQPIASIAERRIVAAEALLRWQPADGEAIGPAAFIPLAEESGLIVPLSERMMSLAFAQAAAWHRLGHPLLISVNLSARQLREAGICRRIHDLAAEQGLSPDKVQLEITESVLMERIEQSERQLLELKEMGFRVALDDFGTGYSSLAYLKNFPIDAIKIDGSFVRGLTSNPRDAAIVRTIVGMSRDLGISTVAEGVETAAELETIAALGCDAYQGFLLSRPIAGGQLTEGLRGAGG